MKDAFFVSICWFAYEISISYLLKFPSKIIKMPIVESRIRNSSPQTVFCLIILLSIFCFAVICFNRKIFDQVLDFKDPTCVFLLCFGVVSVITISLIIHLLVLFGFEYFLSGQSSSVLNELRNHLVAHVYLCFVICLDIAGCICLGWLYLSTELKLHWDYFLVTVCASILCACLIVLVDYDDVELSSSQNIEKSIGANMANGAYSAFYKKILLDITRRMHEFEAKEDKALLVKKLVLICPLSCNCNGTLEGKDGSMEVYGTLKEITHDEGAANNRCYQTNVYKIHGPSEAYIAAEIPSPLATLYEIRNEIEPIILEYHRDCFIQTFKDLTKSENCIVLEYDDINSPEPLHSFLLSKLGNEKCVV